MRRRVLVTDGNERAALAIVRSLGRAGYDVRVTASRTPSLAGASRHARRELAAPNPVQEPGRYAERIRELVVGHEVGVLLPTTEASLISLLPLKEELDDVTIPFPPLEDFLRICDKPAVLDAAQRVGIAIPSQTVLAGAEELPERSRELEFPLVAKPARSVVPGRSALTSTNVHHVRDLHGLTTLVSSLPAGAFPLLLQRPVRGPGTGVFLLVWNGDVLAAFAHRRIREKPPSGGASVFRESIPLDPDLLRRSRCLLEHFGWQGVAMVEYKMDDERNVPVLMEVNGRFWGSLQLAVDSGVDFPALLLAAALEEPLTPPIGYRAGVRCRWWWGEVDHLVALVRRDGRSPEADAAGTAAAVDRWHKVRSTLRGWITPGRNEILRWNDPGPFLRESVEWVEQVIRK